MKKFEIIQGKQNNLTFVDKHNYKEINYPSEKDGW